MVADKHRRDLRIQQLRQVVQKLIREEYDLEHNGLPADEVDCLRADLQELALALEHRQRERQELGKLTTLVNSGLLLEDVLNRIYEEFQSVIPFDRIGFSTLEENGTVVRARWARTEEPEMKISVGYDALLAGSSLQKILETGQPRILNDLEQYLEQRPESESTRLIVSEGIRSSLTCPLIANGVPIGFIFFSSKAPNTYQHIHIGVFLRIASSMAVILEKSRMVSELADQKKAIEAQNAELKRLDELKNLFLGIAAHDLRGPLSTMMLATDMMEDSTSTMSEAEQASFQETYIQTVRRQTQHMKTLLNDLLDMTQIEAGKLTLNHQVIDGEEFLSRIVDQHDQLAAPKGTRVVLESVPDGKINADPLRLQQVLDNLISNAVKYSPPGSTIWVKAEKIENGWKMSVRDSGPGITLKDRQRLFQNFARLSARPTGGEKSTGLGLAITRRVVEAHGGQIDVDSDPGAGATFWFTLPGDSPIGDSPIGESPVDA